MRYSCSRAPCPNADWNKHPAAPWRVAAGEVTALGAAGTEDHIMRIRFIGLTLIVPGDGTCRLPGNRPRARPVGSSLARGKQPDADQQRAHRSMAIRTGDLPLQEHPVRPSIRDSPGAELVWDARVDYDTARVSIIFALPDFDDAIITARSPSRANRTEPMSANTTEERPPCLETRQLETVGAAEHVPDSGDRATGTLIAWSAPIP